jgi:hypothetical protein
MKTTLTLIISLVIIGCKTERIKKEVYLIPENFIGNIVLIYDQPNGIKDSIVNDEIIYKVPKSGILHLMGTQHLQAFKDMKYYYYSSKIINKRICDYFEKDTTENCDGIIWNRYLESFQKDSESKFNEYTVIVVGTKDTIPADFNPVTARVF